MERGALPLYKDSYVSIDYIHKKRGYKLCFGGDEFFIRGQLFEELSRNVHWRWFKRDYSLFEEGLKSINNFFHISMMSHEVTTPSLSKILKKVRKKDWNRLREFVQEE